MVDRLDAARGFGAGDRGDSADDHDPLLLPARHRRLIAAEHRAGLAACGR